MFSALAKVDFFPKTSEDIRMRTLSGGTLSLITIVLFMVLVVIEFGMFMNIQNEKELFVDPAMNEKLTIHLDITFPSLPCAYMSLDVVDTAGESLSDTENDILQQRLNARGLKISKAAEAQMDTEIKKTIGDLLPIPQNSNNCGSCYGAENNVHQCCETCQDVRAAYRDKGWAFSKATAVAQCKNEGYTPKMIAQKNEGCRLYGSVSVSRVAGNFHVAPGRNIKNSHGHTHDFGALSFSDTFNTSHVIHSLGFGEEYEGRVDPLDGVVALSQDSVGLFQYFIKIVPTSITKLNGDVIETNQYSTTRHYQAMPESGGHGDKLPGVFFMYDLSPIKVVYKETSQSWADFLTVIFGTAGGLFTISMLTDWFFFNGTRNLKKTFRSSTSE